MLVALWVLLVVASAFDVASRKIPNGVCLAGLVAGFCLRSWLYGVEGFSAALQGMGTGFFALLPFYLLFRMGAGDVKLMAAIGSFLDPAPVLAAAMLGVFFAGLAASVIIIGRSCSRYKQKRAVRFTQSGVAPEPPANAGRKHAPRRIPLAPFIALATLLTHFYNVQSD